MRSVRVMLPFVVLLTLLGPSTRAGAHSDSSVFGGDEELKQASGAAYRDDVYPALVRIDPRHVRDVVLKVNARITSLRNLYSGRKVKKGDVLMTFDSPELETIQRSFIETVRNFDAVQAFSITGKEKVIEARTNLEWRGLSAADVQAIEQKGEAVKTISVLAPVDGYLMELRVVNGEIVNAGSQSGLFSSAGAVVARIADERAFVIEADVPAQKAEKLSVGMQVRFSAGGEAPVVAGVVEQISPIVAPNQTRQVRITPDLTLQTPSLQEGAQMRVTFGDSHD
ncbi:efflux RND transporter periplasmic adaptor subunit [Bradyrhizobium sp. HKCCYLRH3095]|uniref:efflux RND transporter periplasmic adaptor subunit n=1 Tax=unclassified Bradyrhizobium TaxID=2631580 RepID=UPI003EBC868C